MIIEFAGCTGAGKSTLIAEVRKRLAESTPVTSSYELLASPFGLERVANRLARNFIQEALVLPTFLFSTLRNWAIISFLLRMLSRQPKLSITTFNILRGIERKIGVYEQVNRRSHGRIILVDEGTIHLAHKMFVFSDAVYTPEEIATFARLIPKPDLIVYIKAPPEELVPRTLQRPDPPREIRLKRSRTEEYIRRACAMFEIIFQETNIKQRTLVVDNTKSKGTHLDDLADDITNTILKLKANPFLLNVAVPQLL